MQSDFLNLMAYSLEHLFINVQTLRDQLHDTTSRLGETQTENERLRYLFMSNDPRGLSQLRKSLTAAEQDVIKKQAEMETLRKQLITPTAEVNTSGATISNPDCSTDELNAETATVTSASSSSSTCALLKVQIGVLSKFLVANRDAIELTNLRQLTEHMARSVSTLNDGSADASGCTTSKFANRTASSELADLVYVENLIEQVSEAYKQLVVVLDLEGPKTQDEGTITLNLKECNLEMYSGFENCDGHPADEQIAEMQSNHAEELELLRLQYERQLNSLRERAEYEEQRRRKAQDELQTLNVGFTVLIYLMFLVQTMNEHSIQALKKGQEELLAEQKGRFQQELDLLKEEHAAELQEEKEATRMALDAVQRSHESEVKTMAEKIRTLSATLANYQTTTTESHYEAQVARQSKMLEQMGVELAQLSALYSAKCVENSQLDEKMSMLLADKENQASTSSAETKNKRLLRELKQKDSTIEELYQQLFALEKRVADLTGEGSRDKLGNSLFKKSVFRLQSKIENV
uniref:GRIP domain-containing protein n=1 Tax=Syphacia muris TaxID=451379 RepID=A0A0N5AL69_9BILA